MTLHGNLRGLKTSQRRALERTYRRRTAPYQVVSPELARHLASVSREIGRQVGVLIEREGTIRDVVVGDAHKLDLPDIGRLRGGVGRFRGLRLVHTHLRGEPLTDDDFNDLALLRFDAVAALAVDEAGQPGAVEVALIAPMAAAGDDSGQDGPEANPFYVVRARDVFSLDLDLEAEVRSRETEYARRVRGKGGATERERALLVAITVDDDRLEEMQELVAAAGVELAGTVRQKRFQVHPKTVVGRGKLQRIVLEGMRRGAEVAIFDIDLKPAQARAFEDATGLKAIDRTQLILDIFAQRARSRDGKLQVELAQLKYSLPRLTERDAGLSRLAGGIGGRGPGETVLEIGRRRIRDRIRALEKETARLSRQRDLRRSRRRDRELPVLSIVGYTNAGKSTLLNALTESEIEAADRLFQTLDPTSRRLRFPRAGEVIVTDTVGFLADLPGDLVAAFQATLEELGDADLLLHVVDAADPRREEKADAVLSLLGELGLGDVPRLTVYNKIDLVSPGVAAALAERPGAVAVSATRRLGLGRLLAAAEGEVARLARALEPTAADPRPVAAD